MVVGGVMVVGHVGYVGSSSPSKAMKLSEIGLMPVCEPCSGSVADGLGIVIIGAAMSTALGDSVVDSFCFPSSHSSIAKA